MSETNETLVNLDTLFSYRVRIIAHIDDLKRTLQSIRGGQSSEWRHKIDDDKRPTVRLLNKELCKAEANLVGLGQLAFDVSDTDMKFISMIKDSLEV